MSYTLNLYWPTWNPMKTWDCYYSVLIPRQVSLKMEVLNANHKLIWLQSIQGTFFLEKYKTIILMVEGGVLNLELILMPLKPTENSKVLLGFISKAKLPKKRKF